MAGWFIDTVVGAGHVWRPIAVYGGGALGALIAFGNWSRRNPPGAKTVHGSAQFATTAYVRQTLADAEGLIVGRERRRGGRLLRHGGSGHLLTIAPTRSGKGVGAIIPNLLAGDRSVFCLDPKGENTVVTYAARTRFGPVHVLDPFGVTGMPQARYNPLDLLDPENPDLIEDAAVLAEALVYDPPAHLGEAHWNEEAKALIAGLMLHVACSRPPAERTLAAVRDLLSGSPDEFDATLAEMQRSAGAGGLVRRAANRHLSKSDREAAGVLSSAQRHTHFLDSVRINAAMAGSDFRFSDLKASRCTVFLVLPPDRIDTYARWLRLLVAQALRELARAPDRHARPVLFLLDEFATLGRLEPIERAFGLMAGYGVQLWAILQDMHQLWGAYGERAGTFLSNASLLQVFNVADYETADWISKSLGATTVAYETGGTSVSRAPNQLFSTHGSSTSTHLARRELLTPDEVMRLHPLLEILFRPGEPPVLAQKVRYYLDPEFRGLFTPATHPTREMKIDAGATAAPRSLEPPEPS
ncbi:type IV secretory system conjugative DNA transfer family protein [Phenylobacterium soli]|uniref:Type IV secretory system conjugative DNA transfer family protein n=2 Tax=Phenylobacterium soli TaxID=2170551 RepID=A0A328AMN3_9CAUL|nr:type IV secretory system conjugative DNA transfer family protein [Phenylobacterium soli]